MESLFQNYASTRSDPPSSARVYALGGLTKEVQRKSWEASKIATKTCLENKLLHTAGVNSSNFFQLYHLCGEYLNKQEELLSSFDGNFVGQEFETSLKTAKTEEEVELTLLTSTICQFLFRAKLLFEYLLKEERRTIDWEEVPLVITSISEDNVVKIQTLREYRPYIALSHRWVDFSIESNPQRYKVEVYDDRNEKVAMFDSEPIDMKCIELLKNITSQGLPVWFDLFCILQNDSHHKHCQISIMGIIYACCTTLIVHSSYDITKLVENEYFERTWTFQECAFGSVLPENVYYGGPFCLESFAAPFYEHGDSFLDNQHIESTWQCDTVKKWARPLGSFYESLIRYVFLSTLGKSDAEREGFKFITNRTRKAAVIGTLISKWDFGDLNPDFYFFGLAQMNRLNSRFDKDRLFGVFSVTVAVLGNEHLDYSAPIESLEKIRKLCKAPNFSFCRRDFDFFCSDYTALSKLEQIKEIPGTEEYSLQISKLQAAEEGVKKKTVKKLEARQLTKDPVKSVEIHKYFDPETGNIGFSFQNTNEVNAPKHFVVWMKGNHPNEEIVNVGGLGEALKYIPIFGPGDWWTPYELAKVIVDSSIVEVQKVEI